MATVQTALLSEALLHHSKCRLDLKSSLELRDERSTTAWSVLQKAMTSRDPTAGVAWIKRLRDSLGMNQVSSVAEIDRSWCCGACGRTCGLRITGLVLLIIAAFVVNRDQTPLVIFTTDHASAVGRAPEDAPTWDLRRRWIDFTGSAFVLVLCLFLAVQTASLETSWGVSRGLSRDRCHRLGCCAACSGTEGSTPMFTCCQTKASSSLLSIGCLPQQLGGPFVLVVCLGFGIGVDLVNGFPGAGVYIVGVLGPAVAVAATASNPLSVILTYATCLGAYIGWVVLDTWLVGLWPRVLSPSGGNLPGILLALVGTAVPVLVLPAVMSYAAALSTRNSRKQLQSALKVSQAAGRSYTAVVQLLRSLMPPFAMQCLTNGVPAFETEACIVVVHIAVLPRSLLALQKVAHRVQTVMGTTMMGSRGIAAEAASSVGGGAPSAERSERSFAPTMEGSDTSGGTRSSGGVGKGAASSSQSRKGERRHWNSRQGSSSWGIGSYGGPSLASNARGGTSDGSSASDAGLRIRRGRSRPSTSSSMGVDVAGGGFNQEEGEALGDHDVAIDVDGVRNAEPATGAAKASLPGDLLRHWEDSQEAADALARAISAVDGIVMPRNGVTKVSCVGSNWTAAVGMVTPTGAIDSVRASQLRIPAKRRSKQASTRWRNEGWRAERDAAGDAEERRKASNGRSKTRERTGDSGASRYASLRNAAIDREASKPYTSYVRALAHDGADDRNSARHRGAPGVSSETRGSSPGGPQRGSDHGGAAFRLEMPAQTVALAIEMGAGLQTAIASLDACGYFGRDARVEVGVGISAGSASVVGFLGYDVSAHAWSVLGDAHGEARLLAEYIPYRVRIASSAIRMLKDPLQWRQKIVQEHLRPRADAPSDASLGFLQAGVHYQDLAQLKAYRKKSSAGDPSDSSVATGAATASATPSASSRMAQRVAAAHNNKPSPDLAASFTQQAQARKEAEMDRAVAIGLHKASKELDELSTRRPMPTLGKATVAVASEWYLILPPAAPVVFRASTAAGSKDVSRAAKTGTRLTTDLMLCMPTQKHKPQSTSQTADSNPVALRYSTETAEDSASDGGLSPRIAVGTLTSPRTSHAQLPDVQLSGTPEQSVTSAAKVRPDPLARVCDVIYTFRVTATKTRKRPASGRTSAHSGGRLFSAESQEGKSASRQAKHEGSAVGQPEPGLTSSSGLLSSMVDDAIRLAAVHSESIQVGPDGHLSIDRNDEAAGSATSNANHDDGEIERASSSSESVISITKTPAESGVPPGMSRSDMPAGAATTMDRAWDGSDSSAGRLAKVLHVSSGVSDSVLLLFYQHVDAQAYPLVAKYAAASPSVAPPTPVSAAIDSAHSAGFPAETPLPGIHRRPSHALPGRARGVGSVLPTSMSRHGSHASMNPRSATHGPRIAGAAHPEMVAQISAEGQAQLGNLSASSSTPAAVEQSGLASCCRPSGIPKLRANPTFLHLVVGTPWLLLVLIIIVVVESLLSFWRRYEFALAAGADSIYAVEDTLQPLIVTLIASGTSFVGLAIVFILPQLSVWLGCSSRAEYVLDLCCDCDHSDRSHHGWFTRLFDMYGFCNGGRGTWHSWTVLWANVLVITAILLTNVLSFELKLRDDTTGCLSVLLLDGMSIVWMCIYYLELVIVCSPALWGHQFASPPVIAVAVAICHGFAIINVLLRTDVDRADDSRQCLETAFAPSTGRTLRGPLAFQALRVGLLPAIAAVWRFATWSEVQGIEEKALPALERLREAILEKAGTVQAAVDMMLPRRLLDHWNTQLYTISDGLGGSKSILRSPSQLLLLPRRHTYDRLGISVETPTIAVLAVHLNHVKDLLSLIGPVALFRITREVCAAVEGACIRRKGRRVRVSQEGVLTAFGLDNWTDHHADHDVSMQRASTRKSSNGVEEAIGDPRSRASSGAARLRANDPQLLATRALLSASDVSAALFLLSRRLKVELSVSCSLHIGPTYLVAAGGHYAWDLHGSTVDDSLAIAARAAIEVPRRSGSVIVCSSRAMMSLTSAEPSFEAVFAERLPSYPEGLSSRVLAGVSTASQVRLTSGAGFALSTAAQGDEARTRTGYSRSAEGSAGTRNNAADFDSGRFLPKRQTRRTDAAAALHWFGWTTHAHEQLLRISLRVSGMQNSVHGSLHPSGGAPHEDATSRNNNRSRGRHRIHYDTLTALLQLVGESTCTRIESCADRLSRQHPDSSSVGERLVYTLALVLQAVHSTEGTTMICVHDVDTEATSLFVSDECWYLARCSPEALEGKSAYKLLFKDDLARVSEAHDVNLESDEVITADVQYRVLVGYTTLSAVAACAGVSLGHIAEDISRESSDGTAESSNAGGTSSQAYSADNGTRSGLRARNTQPFREMQTAKIPWHGRDTAILGTVCRSASQALPGELVRPLAEIKYLLQEYETSQEHLQFERMKDLPVPVCRWVSARTLRDRGGKFLISIWRPMLEDQEEIQESLGVPAWDYVTIPQSETMQPLPDGKSAGTDEVPPGGAGSPSAIDPLSWNRKVSELREKAQRLYAKPYVVAPATPLIAGGDENDDAMQVYQAKADLLSIPISFAEFKLLRLLGKGAFGTVYQACHLPSGTSMALKILRAKRVRRRHLRAELNVLSQLPVHPCLPRFFCCISSQKRIFIATEYIDGPTLSDVVYNRGRMSEDALRVLIAYLVCALQELHSNGIVHRDIKPGNVMIRASNGQPVLIDFGLSEVMYGVSVPATMGSDLGRDEARLSKPYPGALSVAATSSLAKQAASTSAVSVKPNSSVRFLREYRHELESAGLVPLLKQLSPSMSLQASSARTSIFSMGPLVFDGSGNPKEAWNAFRDVVAARAGHRAAGRFGPMWAKGQSAVQPRVASVLVFDSRDDEFLAQARMKALQMQARRTAFLRETRKGAADPLAEPEPPASPSDGYHSLVTRMRLQGSLSECPGPDDMPTPEPIGGTVDAAKKLKHAIYQWRSLFWFLDHATNIVPSMVQGSIDFHSAIKGEGWLFDSIIVTDVDSPEVAEALCAELMPMLADWERVMEGHVRRAAKQASRNAAKLRSRSRTNLVQPHVDLTAGRNSLPSQIQSQISARSSWYSAQKCIAKVVLVTPAGVSPATRHRIFAAAAKYSSSVEVLPEVAPVMGFMELVDKPATERAAALHMHDVQLDPALIRFRTMSRYTSKIAGSAPEAMSSGALRNSTAREVAESSASIRLQVATELGLYPMPVIYADILKRLGKGTGSRGTGGVITSEVLRKQLMTGQVPMASMHVFDDHYNSVPPAARAGKGTGAAILKHMQSLLPVEEDLRDEGGEHDKMGLVVRTAQRAPGPARASSARATGSHGEVFDDNAQGTEEEDDDRMQSYEQLQGMERGVTFEVVDFDLAKAREMPRAESTTPEERMAQMLVKKSSGKFRAKRKQKLARSSRRYRAAAPGLSGFQSEVAGDSLGAGELGMSSTQQRSDPSVASSASYQRAPLQQDRKKRKVDHASRLFFHASVYRLERPFINQVAGTPAYLAPEVMLRKASFDSDLWSLGVLAFRCLAGRIPFAGESREEVTAAILRGDIRWERLPRSTKPETLDFLRGLLQVVPQERTGSVQRGGVETLRAHPFLCGRVKWETLFNGSAPLSRMAKHLTQKKPTTFDSHETAKIQINFAGKSVPAMTDDVVRANVQRSYIQLNDSIERMRPIVIQRIVAKLPQEQSGSQSSRTGATSSSDIAGQSSLGGSNRLKSSKRDLASDLSESGSPDLSMPEPAKGIRGGDHAPASGAGADETVHYKHASKRKAQKEPRMQRGNTHGQSMPLAMSASISRRREAEATDEEVSGRAGDGASGAAQEKPPRPNEMHSVRLLGRMSSMRSRSRRDGHASMLASGSVEHRGGSMVRDELDETLDEAREGASKQGRRREEGSKAGMGRDSGTKLGGGGTGAAAHWQTHGRRNVASKLKSREFQEQLEFMSGASYQDIGRMQQAVSADPRFRAREAHEARRKEMAKLARSGFDMDAIKEGFGRVGGGAGAAASPDSGRLDSGNRWGGSAGRRRSSEMNNASLVVDAEEGISVQFEGGLLGLGGGTGRGGGGSQAAEQRDREGRSPREAGSSFALGGESDDDYEDGESEGL